MSDTFRVNYRPVSVLQVLKEMKNLSQLTVDLGYLAILFNEKKLAEKLLELESRIDSETYQLWMSATLAARDAEDAEKIVGVIKVGAAFDEISNAAADLAKMVVQGLSMHPSFRHVFLRLEDRFNKIKVTSSSNLIGKNIAQAGLETKIGTEIIAIKRKRWIIKPNDQDVLLENDILLTKGPRSISNLNDQPMSDAGFDRVQELLSDIVNTTEMMIDLSYSALIYNNIEVAREVISLEEEVDRLHLELELEAINLPKKKGEELGVLGLVRMGLTCEMISDAAASIADIVVRGLEAHEILVKAFEEVEDTVVMKEVQPKSQIDGKTITETRLNERFNIKILAVRRGLRWLYEPDDSFRIAGGDTIIATGLLEGIEEVRKLCSYPN